MITAALFSSNPNVAIAVDPSVSTTKEPLSRASWTSAAPNARLSAAEIPGDGIVNLDLGHAILMYHLYHASHAISR
jgi:hypothetical protein